MRGMPQPAAITVRDLQFAYGHHRLFDGLQLDIARDSITALVGPNGAGKSTLMHCLTGLARPLAGRIAYNDVAVDADIVASRQQMGYLPDNFGLYENLTVAQNLAFAAAQYPHADTRKTIADTHLEDLLAQKPPALSRGMRQRLGIAMAIVHQPPFLLLDEPASGLDPVARADLSALLVALQKNGTTIIVSSHILAELREYASHYVLMSGGRVQSAGALSQLATWQVQLRTAAEAVGAQLTLNGVAGVQHIRTAVDSERCILFNAGDDADPAAILRLLVESGAAVEAFHPLAADIEQMYLQAMASDPAHPPS